jgi:acetyl-CoA acyltransferase
MRDAVIIDAVRTPIGKRGGALASIHPVDLSGQVLQALAARNGLDPAIVDDVLWGCVTKVGEQTGGIGRFAVLAAGWPEHVPAVTIDRQCGSSQEAVHQAAAGLVAGHYDVAVVGGVESMSRVPMNAARAEHKYGAPVGPRVMERYNMTYPGFNQGMGAEWLADEFNLSRTDLDQHALDSHARAAVAWDGGYFADEIAAIEIDIDDSTCTVNKDEGVRRGGDLATLAALPPAFKEGGLISAASSSQISDGAAAMLMTTSEVANSMGWRPIVRIKGVALAGVDPITMLKGPIPATLKVLQRTGLSIDDIGAFEINEAFASVSLGWQRQVGADYDRLNPNGGAIALGHPLGASGARLMTTLVHHMRRNQVQFGLQSMCEAGGMANATVLELVG